MYAHENEVVLAFLQGEAKSPRFGSRYKTATWDLIYNANIEDSSQNLKRNKILASCRGWGTKTKLFENLDINRFSWEREQISIKDLGNARYLNHPQPKKLGGKTCAKVTEGAANIFSVYVPVWSETIFSIVLDVVRGIKQPPLVAIRDKKGEDLYLLEGNTRATAYVVAKIVEPIDIFIGTGNIKKWVKTVI